MSTISSNDAIEIVLGEHRFHPTFTYPIYGENELVYGFDDLKIVIEYDPVTLLPLVEMTYSGNVAPDADSPLENLLKFMPQCTFIDRQKWEDARKAEKFVLPGAPAFKIAESGFSVNKSSIRDCREFLHRFRTFVLFFIEAGSFIDEEDTRWEVYTLVESGSNAFAGFVTVYPYFYYSNGPDFEAAPETPVRKRISQFVVLPPFQHRGLGQKLYTGLVEQFQRPDQKFVRQITIEDPNEAFDVLRDQADLKILAKDPDWDRLSLPVDEKLLATVTERQKLVPRQVRRCLEVALLKKFPKEPTEYRRLVKQRLYEHNYEGLKDIDEGTQAIMLRDVYAKVVEDYKKYIGDDNGSLEPPLKRQKVE